MPCLPSCLPTSSSCRPSLHCSNPPRTPPPLSTSLLPVTPDELADDGEYNEIVEDMREECGKYGRVLAVSRGFRRVVGGGLSASEAAAWSKGGPRGLGSCRWQWLGALHSLMWLTAAEMLRTLQFSRTCSQLNSLHHNYLLPYCAGAHPAARAARRAAAPRPGQRHHRVHRWGSWGAVLEGAPVVLSQAGCGSGQRVCMHSQAD